MKAWKHFKTITYHKYLVMKGCFRVGLYYQGIMHDISKYSPTEFLVGAKYYQGNRSPNNAEREEIGYSSSWLHHKGRNKHHYEYWIDYSSKNIPGGMAPAPMPRRYVVEMLMDRIAASKVYKKDAYTDNCPLEYYLSGKERVPGYRRHSRRYHPGIRRYCRSSKVKVIKSNNYSYFFTPLCYALSYAAKHKG